MKIKDLIKASSSPFYSMEFFPPKDSSNWPAFIETAAKLKPLNPLFVSVTYGAGGGSQNNTVEIAKRLTQDCAYTVMTHLTCVGADSRRIREYMHSLQEIGVDNILALRGDAPQSQTDPATEYDWSKGAFKHATDLIEFIRKDFPDFGIGVAGYPAPHPESATIAEDHHYTAQKLNAGSDLVVTQLFFDVREYIALAGSLKVNGINKPVVPGILPIQSFSSLRHVLSLCGANIPAKLYLALEEADKKGGQQAVREAGLKFAAEQIRRLIDAGAPGIHLYTLNKADTCLELADVVGRL